MNVVLGALVFVSSILVAEACYSYQKKCGSDCCSSLESCGVGKCVKDRVNCGFWTCPMTAPVCCGPFCCGSGTTCCGISCCRRGAECCNGKCAIAGTCPKTTQRPTRLPYTTRYPTATRLPYTTRYPTATRLPYTTSRPTGNYSARSSSLTAGVVVGVIVPVVFIVTAMVICLVVCSRRRAMSGQTINAGVNRAPPTQQRILMSNPNYMQFPNNVMVSSSQHTNYIQTTSNLMSAPQTVPAANAFPEPPAYESVIKHTNMGATADKPPPYSSNPLYASPVDVVMQPGDISDSAVTSQGSRE